MSGDSWDEWRMQFKTVLSMIEQTGVELYITANFRTHMILTVFRLMQVWTDATPDAVSRTGNDTPHPVDFFVNQHAIFMIRRMMDLFPTEQRLVLSGMSLIIRFIQCRCESRPRTHIGHGETNVVQTVVRILEDHTDSATVVKAAVRLLLLYVGNQDQRHMKAKYIIKMGGVPVLNRAQHVHSETRELHTDITSLIEMMTAARAAIP